MLVVVLVAFLSIIPTSSSWNPFSSVFLRPFCLFSLPGLDENSTIFRTMNNITNIIGKLGVEGSADEVITAEMTALSKELTEEEPKIEAALKNFMSVLLAQSATGNAQAHRDADDNPVPLTSDAVLRSVRLLIKKINAWTLPDVVQWGAANPQSEDEGAVARLDALTRVKVLSALHGLAMQRGGKPAKLFGAKFFYWSRAWPALRDSLLNEHTDSSSGSEVSPDEQCLRYILRKFEQSLSSDALDADSDLKLVWTANFAEELRTRQQRRQQEAARRQAELQEQQADLRAALVARLEAAEGETGEGVSAAADDDSDA